MLTLHFTNVDCSSDGKTFPTLFAAVAHGRGTGFEFAVFEDGKRVASWTAAIRMP